MVRYIVGMETNETPKTPRSRDTKKESNEAFYALIRELVETQSVIVANQQRIETKIDKALGKGNVNPKDFFKALG